MAVGKRGVFFTFTALILVTLAFSGLLFQTSYQISEKNKVVSIKTANLNAFVLGFEQDVERGLYIAGYRAVLSAEQFVSDSNVFLNDSEASINEAIMNGTINGETADMMEQGTIPEWLSRIQAEAARVGIVLNFSISSIDINQSDPWKISYYAGIDYNITDMTNTAAFHRNRIIAAEVSIIDLKDPVYTIFTNGKIIRAINRTTYEGNYASGLNTNNLKAHINGLAYANSTGPSYLMRLEGNLGSSPAGIESIVRLPDLQEQGLPVYEKSSVDYVYFGNATPEIFKINNTFEDWFRLDSEHLDKYQVAGITK